MKRYGLLLIGLGASLTQAFYEPQIAIQYKYGHYRQVGKIQLLHPLVQSQAQLFYSAITGLLDNQGANEGNVGLGYRILKEHATVGGYGFYDVRLTAHQNRMHQMTLGLEYLTLGYELRSNVYIPFSNSKRIIKQVVFTRYSTQSAILDHVETPLSGFDIEWSHPLPLLPQAQCSATYYYFGARGIESMPGLRVRLAYQAAKWLHLEGEWSYDKPRKHNYFIGIHLSLALDASQIAINPLKRKMTQMPIRDIDVIVREHQWDKSHREPAIVISTLEELQKMGSGKKGMTLDANYVLEADIDLSVLRGLIRADESQGFKPIGTKKHPFTGQFFGQNHKLMGLFIKDRREGQVLGLFGYVKGTSEKPVLIEKVHLLNSTITGGNRSRVGGIVGTAKHAIIYHVSSQGYFKSSCVGTYVGGVGGEIQKSQLKQIYNISSIQISGHASPYSGYKGSFTKHMKIISNYLDGSLIQTGYTTSAGGIIGFMHHTELKQTYSQSFIKANTGIYIGGLIGCAYNYNSFYDIHSTSRIQISASPTSYSGAIGGLIGYIYNSKLERVYNQSDLHVEKGKEVGGLGGRVFKSHLQDIHSTSTIDINIAGKIGGLIGHMQETTLIPLGSQSHIKSKGEIIDDLIGTCEQSHVSSAYNQSQIERSTRKTNMNTFLGWFDRGIWLISSADPELMWPKRQDALTLLPYANTFIQVQFIRNSNLPLELIVHVFSYLQFYHSLYIRQIAKLLSYALAPATTEIQGKAKKLWTKKEFLDYVLLSEPQDK